MREISATCVNLALGSVMDLHHYVPEYPAADIFIYYCVGIP